MMRSLYSGVSGLKTHQVKMDVIGNNIANVNTVAYKSQSITFSELMYQTSQKASGPNETTGTAGTNAKQIGLGVTSGAISTAIAAQGSTQTTGNAFDLKITGDAFFVVSDGQSNFFTRDGSFYVDAVGNLAMSSTGYNVMGWEVKDGKIVQDTVKKLQILSAENMISPPQATTDAVITGIVDKNDSNVLSENGKIINLGIYDNLGYAYTAKFAMKGTDEQGNYILSLADVIDSSNNSILDKFDATIFTGTNESGSSVSASKEASYNTLDGYTVNNTGELTITPAVTVGGTDYSLIRPSDFLNASGVTNVDLANEYAKGFGFDSFEEMGGLTVNVYSASDPAGTPTQLSTILLAGGSYTDATNTATNIFQGQTMNVDGYATAAGSGIKVAYNQSTGALVGINGSTQLSAFNLRLTTKDTTADNPFKTIAIDMKDSLNLNNEKTSTIGAKNGDKQGAGTGCALGAMTGVSIQNNGLIYGAYDNGQTKLLGQVAFAVFSNASGLQKEGDNLYSATLNSGEFDGIGVDVTADGGYVSTGVLEMSNVDLSSEFTELITTQRGFQANSRIITVSDTLLEELVNLKR